MDIEDFVEAPDREQMVRDVRKKIDALGIEYLYLQFVSVTGKIMGKGIPADHWETVSRKRLSTGLWRHHEPVHQPRWRLSGLRP